MGGFLESNTVWLTATNVGLGLFVLICCVIIGRRLIKDIRSRAKEKRDLARVPGDHLAGLGKLGITMQDGGEKKNDTSME